MEKKELTKDDVSRLLTDPSVDNRIGTSTKIAEGFNDGTLNENERRMAEEIFRVMVKDAEVRVREALALNLKKNPAIPHDVALSLAKDVEQVVTGFAIFRGLDRCRSDRDHRQPITGKTGRDRQTGNRVCVSVVKISGLRQ